jgi:hypothetical protein
MWIRCSCPPPPAAPGGVVVIPVVALSPSCSVAWSVAKAVIIFGKEVVVVAAAAAITNIVAVSIVAAVAYIFVKVISNAPVCNIFNSIVSKFGIP